MTLITDPKAKAEFYNAHAKTAADAIIADMEVKAKEMLDYCYWSLGYFKSHSYQNTKKLIAALMYPSFVSAIDKANA